MKVTVCFDSVRVIVPCGDGSLLVRDLIDKAIIRYKKATAKASNQWVHVHFLKVSSDGGILDPDDQLVDVADDKEQIIADFEEQGRGSLPHNGGDGTSASSTGTASPDLYHKDFTNYSSSLPGNKLYGSDFKRPIGAEVVVTKKDLASASPLKVRRGSEPSLVHVGASDTDEPPTTPNHSSLPRKHQKHHWTTLTVVTNDTTVTNNNNGGDGGGNRSNGNHSNGSRDSDRNRIKRRKRRRSLPQDAVYSDDDDDEPDGRSHGNQQFSHRNQASFSRESARKSLGTGNISSMYKWLDAQERAEARGLAEDRQEPLGGTGLSSYQSSDTQSCDTPRDQRLLISLVNEPGPLGIHVIPNYDEEGSNTSLSIQGIEPGGRIERDGRLRVGDSIVEINGTSLMNVDFNSAQEVFKDALMSPSIDLVILRPDADSAHSDVNQSEPSTPILPPRSMTSSSKTPSKTTNVVTGPPLLVTPSKVAPPTLPKPPRPSPENSNITKSTLSPIRPAELNLDKKKDEPSLERGQFNSSTNTKRIGNKIEIKLIKGAEGLGFSITTRDNPAGGSCPIYIKNILSKGAAIKDGRLKPGDRLLQVNGADLTQKTQSDAVGMLRNAKLGSSVDLLVSRQGSQEQFPRPMKPKSTSPETTEDEAPSRRNREIISLDIPLNETGSAGLGISVKGKTITHQNLSNDLGIFIKSVICGGAAQKDGRLRVNDQLIEVNSMSLAGKTNVECMETLRKAMTNDGPRPGYINLVVSRKIGAPTPTPDGGTFTFQSLGFDNRDYSESVPSDSLLDLTNDNSMVGRRSLDEEASNRNARYEMSYNQSSTLPRRDRLDSPDSKIKPRPHSTIGFQELSPFKDEHPHSVSMETNELPTDGTIPFTREAPGRQSMSEKRKGHLHPKQLDLYQKIKGEKRPESEAPAKQPPDSLDDIPPPGPLKRVGSAESLIRSNLSVSDATYHRPPENEVGPMLGLKKSSSLESLQAAVRELETQIISDDDEGGFWPQNRGRVCNESFRAAVDRSYENQVETGTMEILAEEDAQSSRGRLSMAESTRSSFSEKQQQPPPIPDRSLPSNSLPSNDLHGNQPKPISKENNRQGSRKNIFKGLFKFGQKRKSVDTVHHPTTQQSRIQQEEELARAREEFEAYRAKKTAEIEQKKIREQYEKLKQQQANNVVQTRYLGNENAGSLSVDDRTTLPSNQIPLPNEQGLLPGELGPSGDDMSRADRIQQLRLEHQKRHQARRGRYPLEEQEEWAEREIQRMELKDPTRRYGNSSQDYSSLPDWLDQPDPLYAQVRHDRSLNHLYSDSNLVPRAGRKNDIQGGNLSNMPVHMSPRGPYTTSQETRRATHKSVFDSPRDSPRLRAGSFDQSRSRSETREPIRDYPNNNNNTSNNEQQQQQQQPRYRSKTPNLNSSGNAYQPPHGSTNTSSRMSLVLPGENLLLDPLEFDDPKRAYHQFQPQYAVVNRRPHKV